MDPQNYDACIDTYSTQNEEYCKQHFPEGGASSSNSTGWFADALSSHLPLVIVAIIVIVVMLILSVRIVRQQQVAVVERLGRYNRSMEPGFHLIIPFFEKIAYTVDLQQFNLSVSSSVKTKDDQMVTLPVVVIIKVIPERASDSVYVVSEPEKAIEALVSNEVKAKAATMTLDEIFADRESIKAAVEVNYTEVIKGYGYVLEQVVIDNPKLPDALKDAYNSIAVAEKSKQAAEAKGEALKIEMVKKAEANGQALVIQGKAYVTNRNNIAEGMSQAIVKMTKDTDVTGSKALDVLVAMDSNEAVRDASSNKGTTVVLNTGNKQDATLGLSAAK